MEILFVCTGNTCRSPMATAYLNSKNIKGIKAFSRGLAADGSTASENSVSVMAEKGIDISSHISKPITAFDFKRADKIVCLSSSHKNILMQFAEEEKLCILGNGISDPFGADIDTYRACRDEIFAAVDQMLEKIEIISLRAEHIEKIAELEKICFSTPWSKEGILDSFKRGTKFLVAERLGEALGYIGISCILDEGYITNVAVFPEFRKQGVATALFKEVFSLALENGLKFVSLEVRESNKNAISLYEKLGFKTEGKRKNFYENPREDALILTKRFEDDENTQY